MGNSIGLSFEADDFLGDIATLSKVVSSVVIETALFAGALIIEGKAKIDCPVDTGFLRSTIQAQAPFVGKGFGDVEVIVSAEYGIYVEYGTKFMGAQPFMRPAVYENVELIEKAMEAQLGIGISRVI